MRRLATAALVAIAVAAIVACSSEDDVQPSELERATVDAGGAADAPARDPNVGHDGSAESGADAALGVEFSGQATYYDADGTGACGFKASPNDLNVAAMNGAQYVKKTSCGQCVLVTGPKGTVKVRIVDLCPGCARGGLDLSEQAFAAISPLSAGRIKITWHFVPC
jgi:expansin (peptidoglycan-binding protein)